MGCIDMVEVGQEVCFVPGYDEPGADVDGAREKRKQTGAVVYINKPHRWFMVEYSKRGVKLRECFKFSAVGSGVSIGGK